MRINKIITTVFGNKFNGMLIALMESAHLNWPDAQIVVYYQDIDEAFLTAFSKTYSQVSLIRTSFNFHTDKIQRISSKTLMWHYAVDNEDEGDYVILIDVDTLILKPVVSNIPEIFDVLFTSKKDGFPINTGVLIVKISRFTKSFFNIWNQETRLILESSSLLKEANTSIEYGGADQMSFNRLIKFHRDITTYNLIQEGNSITIKAIPCSKFNETNSRKVTDSIHIIHYKAGWQRVLLEGKAFSKYRNWRDSEEMLILYIGYYNLALKKIQLNLPLKFNKLISLHIPDYIKKNSKAGKNFSYWLLYLRTLLFDYLNLIQFLLNKLIQRLL